MRSTTQSKGTTEDSPPDAPPIAPIDFKVLRSFRQGDLLERLTELPVVGVDGVCGVPTPDGVVLISQTCDVVRAKPPTVQVSRLAHLTDANEARMARDGKMPRFVHVPELGEDAFADLDVVSTIDKSRLTMLSRRTGVTKDDDVRRFGRAVGRRPGRFAFPDEVVPWLDKLTELITSKSGKQSSPEGRLLDDVVEVRVEAAAGWALGPPWNLTLVIVVKPGTLPTFADDELPECPDELRTWLYDSDNKPRRSSSELATRLAGNLTNEEQHHLWAAFGESWAVKCQPPVSVHELGSVVAEVISDDEFTTNRYRRSERLDIDHLSPPEPV